MFYQILLSPQTKQSVIISIKYGIYALPCMLQNDLKRRTLKLRTLKIDLKLKT